MCWSTVCWEILFWSSSVVYVRNEMRSYLVTVSKKYMYTVIVSYKLRNLGSIWIDLVLKFVDPVI